MSCHTLSAVHTYISIHISAYAYTHTYLISSSYAIPYRIMSCHVTSDPIGGFAGAHEKLTIITLFKQSINDTSKSNNNNYYYYE